MRVVVIGGSGRVGTRLVAELRRRGHDAVAASRATGVDAVTGEGLAHALDGARSVVDVTNPPVPDEDAILAFFRTAGRTLLAAEADAGVRHHVTLSVVGTDRLTASGYFRGKLVQEELVRQSGIPYTIVRATQFHEFVTVIAQAATEGETVRVPPVLMQPVAADDVATALADVALAEPAFGTMELAGPELVRQDELVRRFLRASGDGRTVVADPRARYFGVAVDDRSLVPGERARLGATRFEEWLAR